MLVVQDGSCEICGTSRSLEVHHIQPRRMGGSRRPEIEASSNKAVLCRLCHTQITEQNWRLERTDQELVVTDVATGELVARRLFNSDFRPSEYFHELNLLEGRLDTLVQGIPYLTDDQLVDLFSYFSGLDQQAWKARAAILWEAKRRSGDPVGVQRRRCALRPEAALWLRLSDTDLNTARRLPGHRHLLRERLLCSADS
jgi:hypothetical protein